MPSVKNIFSEILDRLRDELFQPLLKTQDFKVERIVSKGHRSPHGFWYDQDQNEWILLLKGRAGVLFKDQDNIVTLNPGDYTNIPSHVKHRVEWTDPHQEDVFFEAVLWWIGGQSPSAATGRIHTLTDC